MIYKYQNPEKEHWEAGFPHLVTGKQTAEIDRAASESYKIPSIILMESAAEAFVNTFTNHLSVAPEEYQLISIVVLVGKGNNGGDGLAIARKLREKGFEVTICLAYDQKEYKNLAEQQLAIASAHQLPIIDNIMADPQKLVPELDEAFYFIDAYLGTGLSGPLRAKETVFVHEINKIIKDRCITWSVDVPSGLPTEEIALTEELVTIYADYTVTFGLPKKTMLTAVGRERCAELNLSPIEFPGFLLQNPPVVSSPPDYWITGLRDLAHPPLPITGHKGTAGFLAVIGGMTGMTGAGILACKAAAHLGVGLVTLITDQTETAGISALHPEILSFPILENIQEKELLNNILEHRKWNGILIGPGLGKSKISYKLIEQLIDAELSIPIVWDADALNILAEYGCDKLKSKQNTNILTPHIGEAGRLLGKSSTEIRSNPKKYILELQKKTNSYIILKDCTTLIAGENTAVYWYSDGSPLLARAGSGDVLAGIISGLMVSCRHEDVLKLICQGVCLHGSASKRMEESSNRYNASADYLLMALIEQMTNPNQDIKIDG